MQFFEAIRLALNTIRVQKLKSAFTLLGVCIGVMFLISVVSIVEGMGRYMEEDLIGKLIGVSRHIGKKLDLNHLRLTFYLADIGFKQTELCFVETRQIPLQLFNFFAKFLYILKAAVNRSKAHVSHMIQGFQFIHDKFADPHRRQFAFT